MVSTASTAPEEVEAAAARLQAEREEYVAMKQGLFRWSLSTTAMCFAAAYTFYSRVLIIYIAPCAHAVASCCSPATASAGSFFSEHVHHDAA